MFDLTQIKLHQQRTMGYKYEKKHMDTSDWASVVHMRARNMFDTAVQTNKLFAHQTREQKKCFKLFDRMFDGLQILSNTIKQRQTRT